MSNRVWEITEHRRHKSEAQDRSSDGMGPLEEAYRRYRTPRMMGKRESDADYYEGFEAGFRCASKIIKATLHDSIEDMFESEDKS